jgi:hypothetical protein
VKIGRKDYPCMNNSPDVIARSTLPDQGSRGAHGLHRDVAHVHDGYQVQTNSVARERQARRLMTVRKTGGVSTLCGRRRRQGRTARTSKR